MMQAIACTHDLGHPPFGHGGEVALNYCMRGAGGFEGNGQTLRILSRLEKMSKMAGSNLTRETMLGVLKYPVSYTTAANPDIMPALRPSTSGTPILDRKASKPPKCYLDTENDVVEWLLETLEASDREAFQTFNQIEGKHTRRGTSPSPAALWTWPTTSASAFMISKTCSPCGLSRGLTLKSM
ncbi:hypothetical protein [Mesorhizobium sp. B2-5-9]|uniref:hypothetical protein n=1 Tax=Mesorhizobium sp. B2-5-9 TaxID=2589921 RepID=UPI001FEF7CBA|nr:hypothetical protein [Mesorhizobium sp. B2-5-9]